MNFNISDNWLEISFLSNFDIVIGMLLGQTDLLESSGPSEDIIFCISDLLVELRKKEFYVCSLENLVCVKTRKMFVWAINIIYTYIYIIYIYIY